MQQKLFLVLKQASKQETCSEKVETNINQDKTCNSINCKTYIYTKVHLRK